MQTGVLFAVARQPNIHRFGTSIELMQMDTSLRMGNRVRSVASTSINVHAMETKDEYNTPWSMIETQIPDSTGE